MSLKFPLSINIILLMENNQLPVSCVFLTVFCVLWQPYCLLLLPSYNRPITDQCMCTCFLELDYYIIIRHVLDKIVSPKNHIFRLQLNSSSLEWYIMCRHHQYFNYLCYKKENTPTLLCNAVLSFLNAVNNEFRTGVPNTCKTANRLSLTSIM